LTFLRFYAIIMACEQGGKAITIPLVGFLRPKRAEKGCFGEENIPLLMFFGV